MDGWACAAGHDPPEARPSPPCAWHQIGAGTASVSGPLPLKLERPLRSVLRSPLQSGRAGAGCLMSAGPAFRPRPGSLARHDRTLLLGGLALLVLLCWWQLLGMARDMHSDTFGATLGMWIVMMTGMMVPTAVRSIMVYSQINARVARRGGTARVRLVWIPRNDKSDLFEPGLRLHCRFPGALRDRAHGGELAASRRTLRRLVPTCSTAAIPRSRHTCTAMGGL